VGLEAAKAKNRFLTPAQTVLPSESKRTGQGWHALRLGLIVLLQPKPTVWSRYMQCGPAYVLHCHAMYSALWPQVEPSCIVVL
jgi:hypothetical protein